MSIYRSDEAYVNTGSFKKILITAGVGGHETQARLLSKNIALSFPKIEVFLSAEGKFNDNDSLINASQKTKIGRRWWGLFLAAPLFLVNFILLLRIIIRRQPNLVISLGPYVSILSFLCCLVLKVRFVHIETRARFVEPSLTCKVLMLFNVLIFVQNESLLQKVNNSYYCGRL